MYASHLATYLASLGCTCCSFGLSSVPLASHASSFLQTRWGLHSWSWCVVASSQSGHLCDFLCYMTRPRGTGGEAVGAGARGRHCTLPGWRRAHCFLGALPWHLGRGWPHTGSLLAGYSASCPLCPELGEKTCVELGVCVKPLTRQCSAGG